MRPYIQVFFALLLMVVTSLGEMQSLVPGSHVTSLNWNADGSLLAYGTGEIIPPWRESSQGGIARVIEPNGTIAFSRNYASSVGNVEVSPTGTLVFVGPFVDVFRTVDQLLIVRGSEGGVGFIDGVWHYASDVLLLTEVLGARTYDPVSRESSSILSRREIPVDSPEIARTVTSVWGSDGLHAATSTTSGLVFIWDITSEVSTIQRTFSGHSGSVNHLVWNAATNLIASGDDSGRILVWNPDTGDTVHELTGHTDAILDIDWRADGQQIVSTSLDNTMRVWDWPSGVGQVVTSGQLVSALAYSPDGSALAYGGEITDPDDVHIEIVPVEELIPSPSPSPAPMPSSTPPA